MQRFDFLVRTRPATHEDRERWEQAQAARGDGITPHQLAVLYALRQLTGQDEGVSAAAWRKALGLAP
jgi:hypothetical protein